MLTYINRLYKCVESDSINKRYNPDIESIYAVGHHGRSFLQRIRERGLNF